jgi:hypothetical protein
MYYDWLWLKEGNCGLTTCTGTLYIVWHCGGQLTRQAVISIWWPFYTGNMNIIYLRHLPLQSYIISLITLSMYWQKKCIYVIVASVFMFLLALQLLLARPASIKWILLATRNFHSPLASWRAVVSHTGVMVSMLDPLHHRWTHNLLHSRRAC